MLRHRENQVKANIKISIACFFEMASQVKIILRVRPLLAKEKSDQNILQVDGNSVKIRNIRNPQENFVYDFDKCFDDRTEQCDIFEHIKPIAEQVLDGQNVTVTT